MVVHQNITNLAGYFHFLNVRKIPYVIRKKAPQGNKYKSHLLSLSVRGQQQLHEVPLVAARGEM